MMMEFLSGAFFVWLTAQEKRLEKQGHSNFIAGNAISIADFAFMAFLASFPYNEANPVAQPFKGVIEKFDRVQMYAKNLKNIQGPYIMGRPKPRPF